MKLRDSVNRLSELLEVPISMSYPSRTRWCIGGFNYYYDCPSVAFNRPIIPLLTTLKELMPSIKTGIITGPESTTQRRFFKIYGVYYAVWEPASLSGIGVSANIAYVFTASKLRNPRFSIQYD